MSSLLQARATYRDGTGTHPGPGTHTPAEWFGHERSVLSRAASDRSSARRVHHDSSALRAETEAAAARRQSHGSRLLGLRLVDIHARRSELERHLARLHADTELLCGGRRRLERALNATELPFMISTDNLRRRGGRRAPDLVHDRVQEELLQEVDLIRNVQDLLKKTLEQVINQIRLNREAQQLLELDWSDKQEAYGLDDQCGRYRDTSTDTQHHATSATALHQTCDPDGWAAHTQGNVSRAECEAEASAALFQLCERVLRETSQDLRGRSQSVDHAFTHRCDEIQNAKGELELQLTQVLSEISVQEENMLSLQRALHEKEAPQRVVQSRLHQRAQRPNMELCRDAVQISLLDEAGHLSSCVSALREQLDEAGRSVTRLKESRALLEKNIACKTHSLLIERHKCMQQRTHYPGQERLAGY